MAGYELDLAFLAIAIYLVINGSKLFSLSKLISHRDSTNAKAL
jgi:putative oxidoreductase